MTVWQDLSEEIARLHGYNNIPSTLTVSKNQGWLTPEQEFKENLCQTCVSLGYDEMLTYSFIGPKEYDRILMDSSEENYDSVMRDEAELKKRASSLLVDLHNPQ